MRLTGYESLHIEGNSDSQPGNVPISGIDGRLVVSGRDSTLICLTFRSYMDRPSVTMCVGMGAGCIVPNSGRNAPRVVVYLPLYLVPLPHPNKFGCESLKLHRQYIGQGY